MNPAQIDLSAYVGKTFYREFDWLTGGALVAMPSWGAKLEARAKPSADPAIVFDTSLAGANIVLADTAASPSIVLSATDETTATWVPGLYIYELELYDLAEQVLPFMRGRFLVQPEFVL